MKNKQKLFILAVSILLILFFSGSSFSQNLTPYQKTKLARAYYQVALYYFEKGDIKKGNAFLQVARFLDPHNFDKPETNDKKKFIFEEKHYIDLSINILNQALQKEDFDNLLSYPLYDFGNNFDILVKDEVIKIAENFSSTYAYSLDIHRDLSYTFISMEQIKDKVHFLPLIIQDSDSVIHIRGSNFSLYFLIRNFGPYLKLIGFKFISE